MSIERNIQTVKNFFAAIGCGDRLALLTLVAEDIKWIIPGEDWPLAGTYRGTRDWQICWIRHPGRWKPPWNPGSLSHKQTGSSSSASPAGRSKPRTKPF